MKVIVRFLLTWGKEIATLKLMNKNNSGQALVLVLLSLSVVLTLILYLLSRSITDVAVSSRQEESVRAFSAAEAGVERALVTGADNSDLNIGYTAKVTGYAENSAEYIYPTPLASGDWATIWFIGHDAIGNFTSTGAFTGNQMKICWGNDGSNPAIEVTVYYATSSTTVQIARAAFDPDFLTRSPSNSFDPPEDGTCNIAGTVFDSQADIVFSSFLPPITNRTGLLFAKIKMFYNDTPQRIGVKVSGGTLPSQGQDISSTGTAGESNRRISVFRGWPEFPFASDALFSPNAITQ